MGILGRKSREEREIERKLAYKKSRRVLDKYLQRCQHLQKKYFEQGSEAAHLGDQKLLRRFALGHLSMQERIRKTQKLSLSLEALNLQREEANISTEFVKFAREMSSSIMEGASAESVAKMQVDLEKALAKAETVDVALTSALDMASETILSSPEVSEESIDEAVKSIEGEAEIAELEMDAKIEEGLKKVEEAMKKG